MTTPTARIADRRNSFWKNEKKETTTLHYKEISLIVDPQIGSMLDKRGIRIVDIQQVIAFAVSAGEVFTNKYSGHSLSYHRPVKTTYWVEFGREESSFRVFSAYSHRMEILEELNMPAKPKDEDIEWLCAKCDKSLEWATVKLVYLDETFAVDIPACPSCQRVFVSENNAAEKMALAEKMLEDK